MGLTKDKTGAKDISTTPKSLQQEKETFEATSETQDVPDGYPGDNFSSIGDSAEDFFKDSLNSSSPYETIDTESGGNSPTKLILADFNMSEFTAPEPTAKPNPTVPAALPDQGSPARTLAVFLPKNSDFDMGSLDGNGSPYNSRLYSAVEQSLVEDRISRYFAKTFYEKALQADPDFFKSAQLSIDENLTDVEQIISSLESIFAEIRNFNQKLSFGQPSVVQNSLNVAIKKMLKIGPLEPMTEEGVNYTAQLFGTVNEILTAMLDDFQNNFATEVLSIKKRTAILGMNLGLLQNFLESGFYPIGFNNLVRLGTNWEERLSDSNQVLKLEADLAIDSFRDITRYLVNSGQTKIGGFDEDDNALPYYEDIFYARVPSEKISNLDLSIIFTTMVANEFMNSAGLGRLIGTPLGNRFGVNTATAAASAVNFCGIDNSSVESETSYAGSLYDDLLISQDGNARAAKGTKVLLMDGSRLDYANENSSTQNSSDFFAATLINNPLNNRINIFSDALGRAQSSIEEALEYYKRIQCRDQSPSILTPRALYTRLLKEVSTSLETAASPATNINKNLIYELAVMTLLGKQPYKQDSGDPTSRLRALMFNSLLRITYSLLQPDVAGSAIASTAEIKSTEVTIDKETPGVAPEKFTVSTQDVSEKKSEPADAFNQNTTKIKLSGLGTSDVDLFTGDFSFSDYEFSISKSSESQKQSNFSVSTESALQSSYPDRLSLEINHRTFFLEDVLKDDNLLLFRIAQIFLDCHDEAEKCAKLENNDASFINSQRLTRSNKLSGDSLLSLVFEATTKICAIFSDVFYVDAKDLKLTKVESIEEIPISYSYGEYSKNGISSRALKLLVECSESNNFDIAYAPDNTIPQLTIEDNGEIKQGDNGTIISVDDEGSNTLSFEAMKQTFKKLADQRDYPAASLMAHACYFDYIQKGTSELVNIGNQILGNTPRTEAIQTFVDFAQTSLGSRYLETNDIKFGSPVISTTVTDRKVDISRARYKKLVRQNNEETKTLKRISVGQLVCLRILFEELYSEDINPLILSVMGLPEGLTQKYLIPKFSITDGFVVPIEQRSFNVSIKASKIFSDTEIGSIDKEFMTQEIINDSSFDVFSFDSGFPQNFDEVVNRIVLAGRFQTQEGQLQPQTGAQFINSAASTAKARRILRNEAKSFLLRKAISVISPIDLFAEDINRFGAVDRPRSSFSQNLAGRLAEIYDLPGDYFNEAISTPLFTGASVLKPQEMLKLIDPTTPKNREINRPPLNLGEADMFTDMFSSLYFKSEQIPSIVFEKVPFEKIICVPFRIDEFTNFEVENSDIQGFSFNAFEAFITATTLYQK